jgi:hypothetical protein
MVVDVDVVPVPAMTNGNMSEMQEIVILLSFKVAQISIVKIPLEVTILERSKKTMISKRS